MPIVSDLDYPSRTSTFLAALLDLLFLSAALALWCSYFELLIATREAHWIGGSIQDWIESLQVLGIYFSAFFALGLIPACVFAPLLAAPSAVRGLVTIVLFSAAAAYWVYVSRTVSDLPDLASLAVPGTLAAMLIMLALLAVMFVAPPWGTALLFAAVALGAIGTHFAAAQNHFLDADAANRTASASLTWAAVTTVALIVIWIASAMSQVRWPVRIASAIVVCALYPALLLAGPRAESFLPGDERANLLFITIDTLRADRCSTYSGPVPTPNMDVLADRGVLFERHYALAPWTPPSLNGLFSGKYPPGLSPNASPEQRAREERSYHEIAGYWLDADGSTFTKRLTANGYETAAIYSNPVMDAQTWLTDGFDEHRLIDATKFDQPSRFAQAPIFRDIVNRYQPGFATKRPLDASAGITAHGMHFLRQPRNRPFALWLHFMDPHTPYSPPESFRTEETPWSVFPPEDGTFDEDAAQILSQEDRRAVQALYEAEIRYVDDCIGRLLYELDRLGLVDNTYVCLTADHGEEFWDHGRWSHGYDLYDEQVRVPLIFAGPQILSKRIAEPVSAIDVLPTIADLLEVDPSPTWHGTTLEPVLRNPDAPNLERPAFAQATHYFRYLPEPMQMIVDGNWKLIAGLDSGTHRLYDLSEDPDEQVNLSNERPEQVERLLDLLETWSASFPSSFNEVSGWQPNSLPKPETSTVDDTLKTLGYTS